MANSLILSLKSIKFIDEELSESYTKLKVYKRGFNYPPSIHKLEFVSRLVLPDHYIGENEFMVKSAFDLVLHQFTYNEKQREMLEEVNIPVYGLILTSAVLNIFPFGSLSLQPCFKASLRQFTLSMHSDHFDGINTYTETLNN